MKVLLVLAAIFAVGLAKSGVCLRYIVSIFGYIQNSKINAGYVRVTLLRPAEVTEDLIENPRYLLWENEDGLIELEDLENNESANITLFATEDDVTFYVYTPDNPYQGTPIKESQLDQIVQLTGFDISRPTLVVIHGWKNHFESAFNDQIKNAALVKNNINVVVADWSPIAKKNYISAQGSVLAVGNYIGDFLLKMDDELDHKIHHITIVGHSLGAHIAGNTGARTKGLIETIIGLDPAGPLFSSRNINNRLDPTDGKYVHVIHTNDNMLGFGITMGHTDYFPNGGSSQPGCGIDLVGSCAHSRAYEYFAESLNNNKFVSKLCSSYKDFDGNKCVENASSHMGTYPIEQAHQGQYYLKTNRAAPFALG